MFKYLREETQLRFTKLSDKNLIFLEENVKNFVKASDEFQPPNQTDAMKIVIPMVNT